MFKRASFLSMFLLLNGSYAMYEAEDKEEFPYQPSQLVLDSNILECLLKTGKYSDKQASQEWKVYSRSVNKDWFKVDDFILEEDNSSLWQWQLPKGIDYGSKVFYESLKGDFIEVKSNIFGQSFYLYELKVPVSDGHDLADSLETSVGGYTKLYLSLTPSRIGQPLVQNYPSQGIVNNEEINNEEVHSKKENFLSLYDEKRKLWVGMERLSEPVKEWWSTRIGCEARILFDDVYKMGLDSSFGDAQTQGAQHMASRGEEVVGLDALKDLCDECKLFSPKISPYKGAWIGFDYNLNYAKTHYGECPETWVCFVSDEPLTASTASLKFLTPSIKMAMTVQMGQSFYSPMGIFRSLISKCIDKKSAKENQPNISLFFHGSVAKLVQKVHPQIEYMVTRPLSIMENIMKTSEIPFSVKLGWEKNSDRPCIFATQYNWQPAYVADPIKGKTIKIGCNHWFRTHDYLGSDFDSSAPYVTASVEELTKTLADKQ